MRIFRKPRLLVLLFLWLPCAVLLGLGRKAGQEREVIESIFLGIALLSALQEYQDWQEMRSQIAREESGPWPGKPWRMNKAYPFIIILIMAAMALGSSRKIGHSIYWQQATITLYAVATVFAVVLNYQQLRSYLEQVMAQRDRGRMFANPRLLTSCILLSGFTIAFIEYKGVQRFFALAALITGIIALVQEYIFYDVYAGYSKYQYRQSHMMSMDP
jgi:hypothetical protein